MMKSLFSAVSLFLFSCLSFLVFHPTSQLVTAPNQPPDSLNPDGDYLEGAGSLLTLKLVRYSGDYGPNFFGHALNTGTYVIKHPDFGWQVFGGNLSETTDWITITPRDSFRMRIYLAHLGLWLTLDSGNFEEVSFNKRTRTVRLRLKPATANTSTARLHIEQPARIPTVGPYKPANSYVKERGAYAIHLSKAVTNLELHDR